MFLELLKNLTKEDKAGFVPPESTVKKSETKVEDKKTT